MKMVNRDDKNGGGSGLMVKTVKEIVMTGMVTIVAIGGCSQSIIFFYVNRNSQAGTITIFHSC